jgi:hypothetical protein
VRPGEVVGQERAHVGRPELRAAPQVADDVPLARQRRRVRPRERRAAAGGERRLGGVEQAPGGVEALLDQHRRARHAAAPRPLAVGGAEGGAERRAGGIPERDHGRRAGGPADRGRADVEAGSATGVRGTRATTPTVSPAASVTGGPTYGRWPMRRTRSR